MEDKEKICYLLERGNDESRSSAICEALTNELNYIVISGFNDVKIHYDEYCDNRLLNKTGNVVTDIVINLKKRIVDCSDIIVVDYDSIDDYIEDTVSGKQILKYARAHNKKIVLVKDLNLDFEIFDNAD